MTKISSFVRPDRPLTALVIGGSGGIGGGFLRHLAAEPAVGHIWALSRRGRLPDGVDPSRVRPGVVDITDGGSVEAACKAIEGPLDLVIVASGLLHEDAEGIRPEKTWRHLNADAMARVYAVNTIGPALIGQAVLSRLPRDHKSVLGVLSARVGSISDNGLGGWHSYRASKAAVNMIIKNFAIELARKNPSAIVCGLHPGTVNTGLSEPFQGNVADGKLFTPDQSAGYLLDVLDGLDASQSGFCFDWAGQLVPS